MKYLIIVLISILFVSCSSQKEKDYKKASKSSDIEYLEKFIEKYPKHEEIERITYRLRVLEYEKVKKSNDLILWKYFINKYKKGNDVNNITQLYFDYKIKDAGSNLKKLKSIKNKFSKEEYIKIVNEKIYNIEKEKILKETDKDKLQKFIKYYPTSKIASQIELKIKKIELNELLESKNIDKINRFLILNPELKTKEVSEKIDLIIFNLYKNKNQNDLKTFLENNKNYSKYTKLENIFIDRSYKNAIAFFDKERLLSLDKKYNLKKYKKDIIWFKKNKKIVNKNRNLINILNKKMILSTKEQSSLFLLSLNSLEISKLILKSSFVETNLSNYLEKTDSFFLITQITLLKSMEILLNRNIEKNEKLFKNQIENIKRTKSKNYRIKLIYLYLTLNDIKNVKNQLMLINSNDFFVNLLKYLFLDNSNNTILSKIDKRVISDLEIIKSSDRLMKNKLDRNINLFFIDKLFIHVLRKMKKTGYNSSRNSKIIERIKRNLVDVKKYYLFVEFEKYKKEQLLTFNKLNKSNLSPILINKLLMTHPLIELKRLLPKIKNNYSALKCLESKTIECKNKKLFFDIFK